MVKPRQSELTLVWANLTRGASPRNKTTGLSRLIFYVHLSYSLFIFYFPRCTLPDFPPVSSLASLPFLSCYQNNIIDFSLMGNVAKKPKHVAPTTRKVEFLNTVSWGVNSNYYSPLALKISLLVVKSTTKACSYAHSFFLCSLVLHISSSRSFETKSEARLLKGFNFWDCSSHR